MRSIVTESVRLSVGHHGGQKKVSDIWYKSKKRLATEILFVDSGVS